MTNKPIAQWAIDEAHRRCGVLSPPPGVPAKSPMAELAIMIERHEQPPVAPELLAARWWYAQGYSTSPEHSANVLSGAMDRGVPIEGFLAGVAWARENGQ